MPFDISEIKKLPAEEKLRIIDELLESMDEDDQESPEVIALLEERMAKIESGEEKFYTMEEAKEILNAHLEAFKRSRKDD